MSSPRLQSNKKVAKVAVLTSLNGENVVAKTKWKEKPHGKNT